MNGYLVVLILLILVLSGMQYFKRRKGFKVTGPLVLFHTKKGIRIIERIAGACPRFWKAFYTFGIAIGFVAMFYIFYTLMKSTLAFFTAPEAAAAAVLVIPGVTIPFWFGIIGLIIVLFFHELSHGIIAMTEGIKLKSVGLAFLGFLPIGAFVEPDEKQLKRVKLVPQLRTYVAGSYMNFIIAALTILFLIFAFIPALTNYAPGAHIVTVDDGGPAQLAGIPGEAALSSIAGQPVSTLEDFAKATKELKPGQNIVLDTDKGAYTLTLGDKNGRGYMGIQAIACSENIIHPLCYNTIQFVPAQVFWFTVGILQWIFILNLGIGMFNLLPLKPFDGGLMAEAAAKKLAPAISMYFVKGLSAVCVVMIVINLVLPYFF